MSPEMSPEILFLFSMDTKLRSFLFYRSLDDHALPPLSPSFLKQNRIKRRRCIENNGTEGDAIFGSGSLAQLLSSSEERRKEGKTEGRTEGREKKRRRKAFSVVFTLK